MRLILVILTAFLCGLVAAVDDSNSKDGTMFIDPNIDVTTIKPNKKMGSRDSETSGDDEDGSGDVQGDASGSGSGEVSSITPTTESQTLAPTTKEENVVVRKVVTAKKKPLTKATTESEAVTSSEKPDIVFTEEMETKSTQPPVHTTEIPTTEDVFAGGIGTRSTGDPNVAARKQEKEFLRVLTKEVIAAVIVGGICAIILIAFLVYRLRKRDEGSYVLTDSAYKDTNKLRGDQGKEAFV